MSTADLQFTRYTAITPKRLSKRFTHIGGALIKEGGGNMTDGIAERLTVASLEEFAALLPTLTPNQALSYGINGHDRARVVVKEAVVNTHGDLPVIARTRDYFEWSSGPGVMMLDYDPAADALPLAREALYAALLNACPMLIDTPMIWRPSASSCIHAGDQELRGIAGQRLYVPVLDARDIPRAGQALFDRLWLAGHGRYELSKSGAFLSRSLIDTSVFQPERLDFCGGADCGKGLVQKLPDPIIFHPDAAYLDTALIPDLSADERQTLADLQDTLKQALAEEQARVRETWIASRVDECVKSLPEAEQEVTRPILERVYRQAAEGGRLGFDFELTVVPKGSRTRKTVTVADLLRYQSRYHEATTLDPLEPDYPDGQARLVGWINLRARAPYLQSQAHGGIRYWLGDESQAIEPPPLDDGYFDAVVDAYQQSRVNGNNFDPSLPTLPSQSISYSFTADDFTYTSFTAEVPNLHDYDEKGRPTLIESAVANQLAILLKGHFAFCRESLRWHAFVGTHWQAVNSIVADELVTRMLFAGATEGFKARTVTAVLSLLTKGLVPLETRNSNVLPFTNGLLDLDTHTLVPTTPDNAPIWCLPYAYDPLADCPTVKAWLSQAVDGDGETLEFLRAWLAALLTGRADLQKFLHLFGPGGTGKGAFTRLAELLIGKHNTTVTDLRNLEQNRFETANLYGKRLVSVTDTSKYGGSIDVLKAMTGQDSLRLERKHQQQGATFRFGGLVLLASNEALQTTDYTSALERRRLTVEFQRLVSDAERADWNARGGEEAILHREVAGVVNWCLALTRDEVTQRLTQQPRRVRNSNWEALRNNNPIADWIIDNTVPAPGERVRIGDCRKVHENGRDYYECANEWLYPNYIEWCQRSKREPLALRRFAGLALDMTRSLGVDVHKSRTGTGTYLQGLRLRYGEETPHDWLGSGKTEAEQADAGEVYLHRKAESVNEVKDAPKSGLSNPLIVNEMKEVKDSDDIYICTEGEEKTKQKNLYSEPLATRILGTLRGHPEGFTQVELTRQVSNARGASPALIELALTRLVKEGAVGKINGRWVEVRS